MQWHFALCGLLLALLPRPAAAGPAVDFDRPGPAIDEIVSSIKADASSLGTQAAPPVGPVKAVSELNYVELAVRDAAQKNHLEADILNFTWSRDPDETEPTLARLQEPLRALRDAPETREQPLYIAEEPEQGRAVYLCVNLFPLRTGGTWSEPALTPR